MNNTSIQLQRIDGVSILTIGNEIIRITDYEIKSSASGKTELTVKLTFDCQVMDFSSNLNQE
ncbi:MAG: hypothetical protein IKV80_08490 [Bacteroidales bacterium]|nr:hypothetical protein [Bacteroidales bacterium]